MAASTQGEEVTAPTSRIHNLGFYGALPVGRRGPLRYIPDFIVLLDDGHGSRRLPAPRRRDQGLPRRGRQGEEDDHGHLLDPPASTTSRPTAAGPSRSSPTSGPLASDFEDAGGLLHPHESTARWLLRPPPPGKGHSHGESEARPVQAGHDPQTRGDAKRPNIPTAELQPVMTPDVTRAPSVVAYERRNRDLDPSSSGRARTGRTPPLPSPSSTGPAALHPGEGAPAGDLIRDLMRASDQRRQWAGVSIGKWAVGSPTPPHIATDHV